MLAQYLTIRLAFLIMLFCLAIIGFAFERLLFDMVEEYHIDKYNQMKKPSFIFRKNTISNWAKIKFIVMREHKALNNTFLSKFSDLCLVLYLINILTVFLISMT